MKNLNSIAGKLLSLAQVMMEEGLMDPLTFNSFRAHEFKLDRGTMTVRFPWGGSIRLKPLEMSVYGLFLRYPSGIRKDAMWKHYSELLELYRKFSLSMDPDWTESVIDSLCDTQENSNLLFMLSHLRGRISVELGELASLRFAINRTADGRYRIAALTK